jgi:hypothetical protein
MLSYNLGSTGSLSNAKTPNTHSCTDATALLEQNAVCDYDKIIHSRKFPHNRIIHDSIMYFSSFISLLK